MGTSCVLPQKKKSKNFHRSQLLFPFIFPLSFPHPGSFFLPLSPFQRWILFTKIWSLSPQSKSVFINKSSPSLNLLSFKCSCHFLPSSYSCPFSVNFFFFPSIFLLSPSYPSISLSPRKSSHPVPPKWVTEPVDSSPIKGDSVHINCQATGHPPPKIVWKKSTSKLWYTLLSILLPFFLSSLSLFILSLHFQCLKVTRNASP